MWDYLKGVALSLVVNVLTIMGWLYMGPLVPASANALIALLILGFYGLEDKWAFPMGYWTVQLLVLVGWLAGAGLILQM